MVLLIILWQMTGGGWKIPQADIERVVKQHIHCHYRGSLSDVNIEFRSVPGGLVARDRNYTVRVAALPAQAWSGAVSFPVEVVSRGRVDEKGMVSVRVRTFDTVLVAARQLGKHDNLAGADIRRERIETTELRGDPLTGHNALADLRTRRIVSAGSVLTKELVEQVPDVFQGSPVTLIVRGRNFRLTLDAVAREDGVKGGRVSVQRKGNNACVRATVLDQTTVEMVVQ